MGFLLVRMAGIDKNFGQYTYSLHYIYRRNYSHRRKVMESCTQDDKIFIPHFFFIPARGTSIPAPLLLDGINRFRFVILLHFLGIVDDCTRRIVNFSLPKYIPF